MHPGHSARILSDPIANIVSLLGGLVRFHIDCQLQLGRSVVNGPWALPSTLDRRLPRGAWLLSRRAFPNMCIRPSVFHGSSYPGSETIMHREVEFLLACSQAAAHDLLESRGPEFRPQLVTLICSRQARNEPVHKVQMHSEIVRGIPLHTTNIRGSGHWWTCQREMSLLEGLVRPVCSNGVRLYDWYDVQMVQEDPKNFFCHIGDLRAPNTIRPRLVYISDK